MDVSGGGCGGGGANSPPPFLTKTYDMVDDPSTNAIVSWSPSSNSFVVWNPAEFSGVLLPKYFKHNNFSSFVRQLNTYGFHKIDPDQWEFANDDFIRGQPHLLRNIHRRKPVHSHSATQLGQGASADAERHELDEEIARLKHDKSSLIVELQKHTQEQHGMERRMQSLEERLQVMDQRQRSLTEFLARTVQRPGFLSDIMQQPDIHSKKRRLPKVGYLSEDMNRASDGVSGHMLDMEPFEKMESSLNSLENFFRCVSEASGEDMYFDGGSAPCGTSGVVLTEMNASSGETDVNYQPLSPKLSPSSPELAESMNYAESPALPFMEIQTDMRSKVAEIDVNSAPVAPEGHSPRETVTTTPIAAAPVGVNDVFWEQFLTETPGSNDMQEVQSERRDPNERRSEVKPGEEENIWWNRKNVDQLTEKMGHLTSEKKT